LFPGKGFQGADYHVKDSWMFVGELKTPKAGQSLYIATKFIRTLKDAILLSYRQLPDQSV